MPRVSNLNRRNHVRGQHAFLAGAHRFALRTGGSVCRADRLRRFERALNVETSTATAESYRQGVELIHRQLADLVRKRGVTPIEALGADFDPNYHQAVLYEPAEGRRDGEVIEEFRRGYMIGDRLLRPSMVKVAKG